jgi:hypothetical protein
MYKKMSAEQLPKRTRKAESRFEKTQEWTLMKADLDRGLSPQEAAQIGLTPEDKARYKITHRRTIARFVKKYIASKGLRYTIKSFQRGGVDYVAVINDTPVVAPRHHKRG